MELGEPVDWAAGMLVLADVGPADWLGEALGPAARTATVPAMMPPVFAASARVLPPAIDPHDERRREWSEIAAQSGVRLTAETRPDHPTRRVN